MLSNTLLSLIPRDIGTSGDVPGVITHKYYGKTAMISSIGAIVIEILTVLSATFLFWPLYRQGLSKLRTRYLIGVVFSDLCLG